MHGRHDHCHCRDCESARDYRRRSREHALRFATFRGADVVFDEDGEVVRVEETPASDQFAMGCRRRGTTAMAEFCKEYPEGELGVLTRSPDVPKNENKEK